MRSSLISLIHFTTIQGAEQEFKEDPKDPERNLVSHEQLNQSEQCSHTHTHPVESHS